MNYTTVTINGEKLGLKFGMASFRYLQEKLNNNLIMQNDELNELGISYLIYSGYYNNCLVKEVEPTYNLEYFVDWVENGMNNEDVVEQIKNILIIWGNNQFIKNAQPKEEKEETKKKSTRLKK